MLLKPSGSVAHVGGQVTKPGEPHYELIRNWIANGAQLKLDTPRVSKIDILPKNPIAQRIGEKQQFRILATYADGKVKDVTRESFVEAGNIELASADATDLVTALRRGEVPILARPTVTRASLDDPTEEFTALSILSDKLPLRATTAPFVKVNLPDPTENVEAAKVKVVVSEDPIKSIGNPPPPRP